MLTRWRDRLNESPFAVDLVATHRTLDDRAKLRSYVQAEQGRVQATRSKELEKAIFKRGLLVSDELEATRAERRALHLQASFEKARRDVEISERRAAQVASRKKAEQAERQQRLVQKLLLSNGPSSKT